MATSLSDLIPSFFLTGAHFLEYQQGLFMQEYSIILQSRLQLARALIADASKL